ncbi:unnamed protein product [Polarella glacialis]|uniref:Uncharacterized protein n=1 Tax=Polarella glacialis TaxID=89957 RepID=A0A813I340_POLGL|nr:unnamed protein product [Polarella glacialis]
MPPTCLVVCRFLPNQPPLESLLAKAYSSLVILLGCSLVLKYCRRKQYQHILVTTCSPTQHHLLTTSATLSFFLFFCDTTSTTITTTTTNTTTTNTATNNTATNNNKNNNINQNNHLASNGFSLRTLASRLPLVCIRYVPFTWLTVSVKKNELTIVKQQLKQHKLPGDM